MVTPLGLCVCPCAQSCPICDPMDCSPPGSSVHRLFQVRTPDYKSYYGLSPWNSAFNLKMLCQQKFSTSDYAGNKRPLFVWKHALQILVIHEQEVSSNRGVSADGRKKRPYDGDHKNLPTTGL